MKYQCPKNRKVKLSLERARVLLQEHPDLTEYYICNVCWHYHLTSYEVTPRKNRQNTFEITRIQREMKYEAAIMATRKELVIAFLKDIYRKDGIYKVTNEAIRQLLDETSPGIDKQAVSALTSTMKKEGLLMNLDETTPNKGTRGGGPPARYFALSSIINEMTKPSNKEVAKVTETPKPKPTSPANVPNDVIVKRINEVNNTLGIEVRTLRQELKDLSLAVHRSNETMNSNRVGDGARLVTIESILNKFIQAYNSDRFNTDDFEKAYQSLIAAFNTSQDNLKAAFHKIMDERDGSEDYKRGVKDGIALAIEMGLKTRE